MPDEEIVTEETAPETPEAEAPTYTFPFDIPADLAVADEETLRSLHQQVLEHGRSLAGSSPADTSEETLLGLRACHALAVEIRDALIGQQNAAAEQADRDAERADLSAGLDDLDLPEPEPAPAPTPEPAAVTASTRRVAPSARQVAARRPSATRDVPAERATYASLTASADFAGFATGQELQVGDVAQILSRRLDQYPAAPVQRSGRVNLARRPVTVYDPESPGRMLEMRNYARHAGVQIRREFPTDQRIDAGNEGRAWDIALQVASERRLPGGNLINSMREAMKTRRSLTAAAGWCAPSDTIYDLLELETLEGILDAPELQTPRGGWQIPEDGGPDFSSIWSAIGNSGDTHLTEAEVIADTNKVCTEITCPDFIEKRLDVDYVCLTGSLLQRRGYPEAVARFTRAAVIALAHKINAGYINALVAGSNHRILGSDVSGDDAASAVLAAIELAAQDIRYRNRMSFNATVEAVFPAWVRGPIRAGLSRRTGLGMFQVTDAMIMDWMTDRGVAPRFVYDWQDNYNGAGLGAATPASAYPALVSMLVFPAGTWVKAVADVIDLDTIYDSTNLATNQYTALFSETGWQALKMGPTSYQYTVPVDVSGVTGCCPSEEIS